MKQKILAIILVTTIIIALFGCQHDIIPKPDTEIETITQNTEDDYITFTLEIPKNWNTFSSGFTSIICTPKEAELLEETSPYLLRIESCLNPSLVPVDNKTKQTFENLFNGDYEGIEKLISNSVEFINAEKVIESYPDAVFNNPESIMEYFNILIDGINTPDVGAPENWDDKEWAYGFTYDKYNGKNGKIITVEYSMVFLDKTYKAISCYRDDYYSVSGVFDNNDELSAGEIALWVADNMKVTEHYTFENHRLIREKQ